MFYNLQAVRQNCFAEIINTLCGKLRYNLCSYITVNMPQANLNVMSCNLGFNGAKIGDPLTD